MRFGLCGPVKQLLKLKPGTVDYAELALFDVQPLTESELKEAEKILTDCGLKAETTNGFFPGELRLCGKDYRREKVDEYTKIAFEKAKRLGVELSVLGSGTARRFEEGDDIASCTAQLDEMFWTVGERAKEYGITVAIEPLNRGEVNNLNSVAEAAETVRRVGHPYITVMADFFHVAKENEPFSIVEKEKAILTHLHISRPETRTAPLPDDGYDYSVIKKALDAAGYNGRMSVEGRFDGGFTETATKCYAYLREVFGD